MKQKGWNRLEEVNIDRTLEDAVLPCFDAPDHRIKLEAVKACTEYAMALTNQSVLARALIRHTVFISMAVGPFPAAFEKTGFTQAEIDEVAIGCALERYRMAESKYPETLAALTPRFAPSLPPDPMTGQPYHYHAVSTNRFILYSDGWNGTDDGGKIVLTKATASTPARQNPAEGDWVFEYPE